MIAIYGKSEEKVLERSASEKGYTRAEDVTEEDHVSEELLAKLDEFLH